LLTKTLVSEGTFVHWHRVFVSNTLDEDVGIGAETSYLEGIFASLVVAKVAVRLAQYRAGAYPDFWCTDDAWGSTQGMGEVGRARCDFLWALQHPVLDL